MAKATGRDGVKKSAGRPPGIPASAAQKAAGAENLKKAHKAKAERAAARKAGKELEKPRWKQLEDGDISPRDLTDKELVRHEVANNDGSWEGRRHALNPRMIQRLDAEFVRRMRSNLGRLGKPAQRALRQRLEDSDNPAQQLAASIFVHNHLIGKPPEIVHVGAETEFDRMKQSAFVILRGNENVTVEQEELDATGQPPVDAEWTDEGEAS